MLEKVQILKIAIFMVVFFSTISNEQETEWYFFDQPIQLYSVTTSNQLLTSIDYEKVTALKTKSMRLFVQRRTWGRQSSSTSQTCVFQKQLYPHSWKHWSKLHRSGSQQDGSQNTFSEEFDLPTDQFFKKINLHCYPKLVNSYIGVWAVAIQIYKDQIIELVQ